MKCPYCGSRFEGSPQYCPICKQPLSRAQSAKTTVKKEKTVERVAEEKKSGNRAFQIAAFALMALVLIFGIYKLTFWVGEYRLARLYSRGAYTPTVQSVTMSDGRAGHSIVFYGSDGDQIFIPELNEALPIVGGVARTTVADSDWFGVDVSEIDSANVCLSPVLLDETGKRTELPKVKIDVPVPEAPLKVLSPASNDLKIVTSKYPLELQVVPGSSVIVNGEDVTSQVDRSGWFSSNVNIRPIGDNLFTIVVRTDHHHDTRREVKIYRENFDIGIELDTSVGNSTTNKTMAITGTVEVGATITVDTEYLPESLQVDEETGHFQFIAKVTNLGENTIRFRAVKEGKQDAVVSMTVDYKPTLAEYSAKAWKMDYSGLRRLYEQWTGQVFQCIGPVVDTVREDNVVYWVMDVSGDRSGSYLLIENRSGLDSPILGRSYTAYADVNGRKMYNSEYYPVLVGRYIDLTAGG